MQFRPEKQCALLQVPQRSATFDKEAPADSRLLPAVLGSLIVLQITVIVLASGLVLLRQSRAEQTNANTAFSVPAVIDPVETVPTQPTITASPTPLTMVPAVIAPSPTAMASPTPRNLAVHLRGMEITQGIQVLNQPEDQRCNPDPGHSDYIFCNNSIPLVAGRHTLVRAYLACNNSCPMADTTVTLRVLKNGRQVDSRTQVIPAAAMQQVDKLSLFDQRSSLQNSVNFTFIPPPPWLADDVTFELAAMSTAQPQRSPVNLTLTRTFARRKPLQIAYLPIDVNNNQPADPSDAAYWMLRMFPVPAVAYQRLPAPNLAWDGDLSKSELLRKLLYYYWFYAQSQPPENRPDQLFGWLPQEIYNGGASDPFWCPNCAGPHSSRVAFGGLRPEQDIGGPRILAHEVAHNLGAQHASSPTYQQDSTCFRTEGVDIRVDPAWPYADTPHIQEFGIDLYSEPPIIYPPTHYDMMAYCAQPWISPHTYRTLFSSPLLQPDVQPDALPDGFQSQPATTENGTLLVSGLIFPSGVVDQPEIIKLNGDAFGRAAALYSPVAFKMPPGDDYCLHVYATDNTLLTEHCFNAGFENVETGLPTDPAPFFFALPQANLSAVGHVVISRQQVEQVRVSAGRNVPQVEFTAPLAGQSFSGEQTITWNAFDADGDSLQFDLFYSTNNGDNWLPLALRLRESHYTFSTGQLPPAEQIWLRLVASDGFNTGVAHLPGSVFVGPSPAEPAMVSP